ncbi:hypothetical protein ACX0G9_25730 [Flavitalea flava]
MKTGKPLTHENPGISSYLSLIQLDQPFFELIKGKLYDCQVEHQHGIDDASIIPLAFEKGKNRLYVMTDARRLLGINSTFVYKIINMDFDYMWQDGIHSDCTFDYSVLTIPCATHQDGTLIDFSELQYFDFVLTNEL